MARRFAPKPDGSRSRRVYGQRWAVEHAFRVAEAGLTHYEGRSDVGLTRHQTLCLLVVGFVASHADGLRGKNPEVTAEQVCRALNARCGEQLARGRGTSVIAHTAEVIQYHQRRNRAARTSKRRRNRLPKPLPPQRCRVRRCGRTGTRAWRGGARGPPG